MQLFTKAIIVLTVAAQTAYGQKFSIGPKVGAMATYTNFADIEAKPPLSSSVKMGFLVGGIIDFPLKKNYSFQFETGFSQQGRVHTDADGWEWNNTYYFTDFALALKKYMRVKIKKDVVTNLYVGLGPNVNYWLAGNGRLTAPIVEDYNLAFDQVPNGSYNTLFVNNVNRWLFGLNLGVGFMAKTKQDQKIITEFRLTWGQTYLGERNSATYNVIDFGNRDNMKANLKTLSVSVSYVFDKDLRNLKKGKSTKGGSLKTKSGKAVKPLKKKPQKLSRK